MMLSSATGNLIRASRFSLPLFSALSPKIDLPFSSSSPPSKIPNPNPISPSRPSSRYFSDWRSPLSHRAFIRSSAAIAERFERRLATMGKQLRRQSLRESSSISTGSYFADLMFVCFQFVDFSYSEFLREHLDVARQARRWRIREVLQLAGSQ